MALVWLFTEPLDDQSLDDWQRTIYYRNYISRDGRDDEPFMTFAQYIRGQGKPQ